MSLRQVPMHRGVNEQRGKLNLALTIQHAAIEIDRQKIARLNLAPVNAIGNREEAIKDRVPSVPRGTKGGALC